MNASVLLAVLNRCQEYPGERNRYADIAPLLSKSCRLAGIITPAWVRQAIVLKSRYEFASTQLDCGEALADIIRAWAARVVAEGDRADRGLEKEPHVTVRYGLRSGSPEDVAKIASRFPPVQVHFGSTSVFRQPEHDVLKIDVDGLDLRRLNAALAALPHTDTHPDYQPHLTLAYLKPGMGHKYSGLRPYEHTTVFDGLMVSTKEGKKVKVPFQAGVPEPRWHAHALASGMEVLGNSSQAAFGKRYITHEELLEYSKKHGHKIETVRMPGGWLRSYLKPEYRKSIDQRERLVAHMKGKYGTQTLPEALSSPRAVSHIWLTPEGDITGNVPSHYGSAHEALEATRLSRATDPQHRLVHEHGFARAYMFPTLLDNGMPGGRGIAIQHGPEVSSRQKRALRDLASLHDDVHAEQTGDKPHYGPSPLGLEREALKKATRVAVPLTPEQVAAYEARDKEIRSRPFYPWHETTEMVPTEHMLRYRDVDREEQEKYPGQLHEQRESIKKEGIKEPLILIYGKADQTATLGEGNTRLANAHALGISHVPVRVVRWSGPRNGAKVPKPPVGDRTGYIPGDLSPSDLGIPTKPATEKSMRLIFKSKRRGLPPRVAVADEDWEHPFDKMDNRTHDYHMRHHVREWQGLQSELVTTDPNDEMGRTEVVEKMRKLAGHHQGHSRMRFVFRPGNKGGKR